MKRVFLYLLFASFASIVFAQTTPVYKGARPSKYFNSIQLELVGHGGVYSLNHERILLNGKRFKTGIRAGIGCCDHLLALKLFQKPEFRYYSINKSLLVAIISSLEQVFQS